MNGMISISYWTIPLRLNGRLALQLIPALLTRFWPSALRISELFMPQIGFAYQLETQPFNQFSMHLLRYWQMVSDQYSGQKSVRIQLGWDGVYRGTFFKFAPNMISNERLTS